MCLIFRWLSLDPSRTAALSGLEVFVQSRRSGLAYSSDRNADHGPNQHHAVSNLSAHLRHRLLLETEVLAAVLAKEGAQRAEKFIQEVCWRTYWKGWLEHRPHVWTQYKKQRDDAQSLNPALIKAIAKAKAGQTGIDCFDAWANELVQTGYLHNHARMWFASIWIFTLRLPWAQGADWFMQTLRDADAASNTLSWRWVAGLQTVGKHYLARAENIHKNTGGRFDPRGQLNESAAALTTPDEASGFAASAARFTHYREPVLNGNEVLLLHEDDCYVESLPVIKTISALIVVPNASARSPSGVSAVSRAFTEAALQDAVARAAARWQLKFEQVIVLDEVAQLFDVCKTRAALQGKAIVHAWLPVGPTRDALELPLQQVASAGIAIHPVLRSWDQQAWPLATRGFFQFKTKIPELLRDQFTPELF